MTGFQFLSLPPKEPRRSAFGWGCVRTLLACILPQTLPEFGDLLSEPENPPEEEASVGDVARGKRELWLRVCFLPEIRACTSLHYFVSQLRTHLPREAKSSLIFTIWKAYHTINIYLIFFFNEWWIWINRWEVVKACEMLCDNQFCLLLVYIWIRSSVAMNCLESLFRAVLFVLMETDLSQQNPGLQRIHSPDSFAVLFSRLLLPLNELFLYFWLV